MNQNIKFIDLFAGIGGFRLAFQSMGYQCVFSSESNKACQKIYQQNYNDIPQGDITKINPQNIPDFDVLCAGFPCQPFSICGKQQGFEDTRGTLFFNICQIIKEKQPKVILLENVKHLINHNKKRTFKTIINTLQQLGYKTNYKILNATNYGVPQARERIIIVATKHKQFIFNNTHQSTPPIKIKDILDDPSTPNTTFEYLQPHEYTILDNSLIKTQKSGLIFCGYRNKTIRKNGVKPNTKHLSRCHRQPNRIYSIEGIHPTLPSQESSGRFWIYLPEENRVRKLTINECYKLMGFPTSFKIDTNKANAYKQCGNSVVVPMIEDIAKQIKQQFFL